MPIFGKIAARLLSCYRFSVFLIKNPFALEHGLKRLVSRSFRSRSFIRVPVRIWLTVLKVINTLFLFLFRIESETIFPHTLCSEWVGLDGKEFLGNLRRYQKLKVTSIPGSKVPRSDSPKSSLQALEGQVRQNLCCTRVFPNVAQNGRAWATSLPIGQEPGFQSLAIASDPSCI